MKKRGSRWPDWAVMLAICVIGASVYVVGGVLIEVLFDWHAYAPHLRPGQGSWTLARFVASAILLVASLFHAVFLDALKTSSRRRERWVGLRLVLTGMAGGVASAVLLNAMGATRLDGEIVVASACIGAVLAFLGVFRFIAQGL